MHQLTGFADPVYCEAYVSVHEFDIVLEMLVINRTDTTLTNVMVELSVMGDLKLVDRPPIFTLGPRDSRTLKANIKVSSTETVRAARRPRARPRPCALTHAPRLPLSPRRATFSVRLRTTRPRAPTTRSS